MSLGKFDITLNTYGTGSVLLDGHDVAKYATSVTTRSRVGEPPLIEMEYIAEVHATLDAIPTHYVFVGPVKGKGPTLRAALEDVLAQIIAEEDAA